MKLLLTIAVWLPGLALFAQEKLSEDKRNEFEAQKIAFFTQALELSPEEAVVFWPLYNEMQKKIREQEDEKRKIAKRAREDEKMTDKQSKELLGKLLDCDQKMLNIKKEYYHKLADKVSPRKACKLDWVERKFHRQLLDKMRQMPSPGPKK